MSNVVLVYLSIDLIYFSHSIYTSIYCSFNSSIVLSAYHPSSIYPSIHLSIHPSICLSIVSVCRSSLCLFIFCFLYQSVYHLIYRSVSVYHSYLCFSCNIHVHLKILECREKDKRTFCNLLFYLESGTYCVPQFILLIVIWAILICDYIRVYYCIDGGR